MYQPQVLPRRDLSVLPAIPDLCPLPLAAGAAHAVNAADGPAVVADFVIVGPALAVEKNGAAEGEGHLKRSPSRDP
jgi:hypothetical protein